MANAIIKIRAGSDEDLRQQIKSLIPVIILHLTRNKSYLDDLSSKRLLNNLLRILNEVSEACMGHNCNWNWELNCVFCSKEGNLNIRRDGSIVFELSFNKFFEIGNFDKSLKYLSECSQEEIKKAQSLLIKKPISNVMAILM